MYEDMIRKAFETAQDDLSFMRRHFHMHPELSRQEYDTARHIEQELRSLGLEPVRIGETGVCADIVGTGGGKQGRRTILLRADTDALPVNEEHNCPYKSTRAGVMHACGHDAHTASLLGAAKFLAGNRNLFCGTVRLLFQQAEETGFGAVKFIQSGGLEGVDRAFGVHVDPSIDAGKVSLTPGPNNASVDWFVITVNGKQAHISAPQSGIDALYAASRIVIALHELEAELSKPSDRLLIGVGKLNAGTSYNIIAGQAVVEGTIRAMNHETRKKAVERLVSIAQLEAGSIGAGVSVQWKDGNCPLINDIKASREAQAVAAGLFGEENVITDRPFSLGGDDFAEILALVPGVFAYVGSGNDSFPQSRVSLHSSDFDIDESCLQTAASLYAACAVNYLNPVD